MNRLMKVAGLSIDPFTHSPIMILKDPETEDSLPIWIGPLEATAIASELEGIEFSRPMTHDLFASVLSHLEAKLESIEVCDLKANTFYALLHVKLGDRELVIDSRPSDAIALALRCEAPIYVAEEVLEASARTDGGPSGQPEMDDEEAKKWTEMLEGLDPDDFGKYKM